MDFYDKLEQCGHTLVRRNPVDWQRRLTELRSSLSMLKAQRCVIVHALNGDKAKAEQWVAQFHECSVACGELLIDSPNVSAQMDVATSDVRYNEANENGYKTFMEQQMKTHQTLNDYVRTM